jgi:tetratricopeptide (TPR) repeat protein
LAFSIIFIFSFLTFARNGVWRDESSIHKELISINLREIKEFPAYGQLYANLANSYMVLGNYEEAERALEKANELDPSNPAAHFKLAAILKMKGKPLEAIEELKKSLNERTPFPDEVYANMAAINHDLGRIPEAEAQLKMALGLRPQVSNYHLNFGMLLLEKGEQDSALDEFITAGKLDPDSFDAFFQQGLLYGGKKEFGKAIESLNRAVEIDPYSPEAHFYLGAAYESSGNRALALKEARKAIELRPEYPQAKRLLELMR